ncbi:MAG: hypothetical protein GF308_11090 [Candidatus Heimdallarchaeota archaeon]|nr:hypothetical protein [Candidatus Heimdallarchaeota archaeon]
MNGDEMFLEELKKSHRGLVEVIATILITGLMVTSIALTYFYIVPTIDRGQLDSTLSASSLFLTKVDGNVQSLFNDGLNASRSLEIDIDAGIFDISNFGVNIRTYIDGSIWEFIPITIGIVELTIPSDVAVIERDTIKYIKGDKYFPIVVTEDGPADPGTITLERPEADEYKLSLWYRLVLLGEDDGTSINFSLIVYQFTTQTGFVGLHDGNYELVIKKQNSSYSSSTTSGDNFRITTQRATGLETIFTSSGSRTSINFHLQIITLDFELITLLA